MNNKLIFCFTYAGGTAQFYDPIGKCLEKKNMEVVKLEYSGHGKRYKEPLLVTFEETAEDLYQIILKDYGDRLKAASCEYALMGYSMGSMAVIEVLKLILRRKEILEPVHIFLGAHEPKTKDRILNVPEDEMNEYVKKRTVDFGGIPEKLLNNQSFWRMYLPLYRADYLMIAGYNFENLMFRTEIPATIFYSETDTKLEDMKHWKDYFLKECEFIPYAGKHFFINEHYREMATVIESRLENL